LALEAEKAREEEEEDYWASLLPRNPKK